MIDTTLLLALPAVDMALRRSTHRLPEIAAHCSAKLAM